VSFSSTGRPTADARRIIAKKEGEQAFSRMKDLYLKGVATIHKRTDYPPMSQDEGRASFGDLITSGAYAFNAAHSAGYGLVACWSAWWKAHHIDLFYAACLSVTDDKAKKRQLLRDAERHGVRALLPDPSRSVVGWQPVREGVSTDLRRRKLKVPTIRSGFVEIDGIGPKSAQAVVEYRDARGSMDWGDLINLRGVGPKTIDKIEDWLKSDDPFGAFALARNVAAAKEAIHNGALKGLPYPTHAAVDIPSEQGREFPVTWMGTFIDRNIRDIFEQNQARTGEALDPARVKDPHLNEWAMLSGEDETDQLLVKIDRWKWPKFKQAIFDFKMGEDILLIEGVRPRYVSSRQIKVKRLYVIEP
jgi:DNA polymerase-3 subunit alpha